MRIRYYLLKSELEHRALFHVALFHVALLIIEHRSKALCIAFVALLVWFSMKLFEYQDQVSFAHQVLFELEHRALFHYFMFCASGIIC